MQRADVQAMVLADRVYQDVSGKYIIAGTFNGIQVGAFPAAHRSGAAVYSSLTGLHGEIEIQLLFKESASDTWLVKSPSHRIRTDSPLEVVEIVFQLPPLPLPHDGKYEFELRQTGVGQIATASVSVSKIPDDAGPQGA